jgi:microcystin-dependent protein
MVALDVGTIICVAFPGSLTGYIPCDGRLLPIIGNSHIFALLGTRYGGDGTTNFALPDLRGRAPRHVSSVNPIGTAKGKEVATLDATQLPAHTHEVQAAHGWALQADPKDNLLAAANPRGVDIYSYVGSLTPLDSAVISSTGSGQPHDNIQPYLAMNYLIAVQGTYPSRTGKMDVWEGFLGEIRLFASHQIPPEWIPCDGQLLDSASNQALYSLIGNTYGSPQGTFFRIPELRGRLILGAGSGPGLSPYKHGQRGGSEGVALTEAQMPAHNHIANSNSLVPISGDPTGKLISDQAQVFNSQPNNTSLAPATLKTTGNHVPHNNMMPFLTLTYCICVNGQFPFGPQTV